MSVHTYEVHLRKDKRGVELISDVLPFGRVWYDTPDQFKSFGSVDSVNDPMPDSLPSTTTTIEEICHA